MTTIDPITPYSHLSKAGVTWCAAYAARVLMQLLVNLFLPYATVKLFSPLSNQRVSEQLPLALGTIVGVLVFYFIMDKIMDAAEDHIPGYMRKYEVTSDAHVKERWVRYAITSTLNAGAVIVGMMWMLTLHPHPFFLAVSAAGMLILVGQHIQYMFTAGKVFKTIHGIASASYLSMFGVLLSKVGHGGVDFIIMIVMLFFMIKAIAWMLSGWRGMGDKRLRGPTIIVKTEGATIKA